MKISRLFAGVLIVALGVALFLTNFDVLSVNWRFIFKLWPVLLVFGGISVLVSNSKWRAVLYGVTSVLVILWIFSAASVGWGNFHGLFHRGDRTAHTQEFVQDMEKGIRHGQLRLNSGAGTFNINDTTDDMFYARAETNVGYYSLDVDKDGATETLNLNYEEKNNSWNFGGSTNTVDMKLNPNLDWKIVAEVGACSTDFDLTPYIVRRVELKAGASSLKVKVGDRADSTTVKMDAGASSITVYVPQGSGCQISDRAELSSKSFPDFVKGDDGTYHTANFENSRKKVFIEAEAGVSSIKVRRY